MFSRVQDAETVSRQSFEPKRQTFPLAATNSSQSEQFESKSEQDRAVGMTAKSFCEAGGAGRENVRSLKAP